VKIAAALNKPDKTSQISESFGKSEYFFIFDTDTESEIIIHNPFINVLGGACIQAAQIIIENGVDAVIACRISENALRFLSAVGIKVYHSSGISAEESIHLLLKQRLKLVEINPDFNFGNRKRRRFRNHNNYRERK
jgi:predicted Fe-Mo cluster-binding NifX family protein